MAATEQLLDHRERGPGREQGERDGLHRLPLLLRELSSLETRFATDTVSGAMAAAARRSACATDSVSGAMAAAARRSACAARRRRFAALTLDRRSVFRRVRQLCRAAVSKADATESDASTVLAFTFLAVSAALPLVALPTACSASDNSAPADVRLTAAPSSSLIDKHGLPHAAPLPVPGRWRSQRSEARRGRIERATNLFPNPLESISVSTTATATLHTTAGDIRVNLFGDQAPKTVRNFTELALGSREWTNPATRQKTSEPLYNGTIFHRVILTLHDPRR